MKQNAFRQFLITEMESRQMSNRQFGQFVGVSNTTINRLVDAQKPDTPTLDVLLKISQATKVSLFTLIELAYPDVVEETQISPSAKALAQRIEKLPTHVQEAIAAIVRGSGVE